MILIPVPTAQSFEVEALWRPHAEKVAKRMRLPLDEMLDEIKQEITQVHLVWDDRTQQAIAAMGTRILTQGGEKVGQIHWCGGAGLKDILAVVPTLETYMRDHLGCTRMTFTGREGWEPLLKKQGYAVTHIIMGKAL